MKYLILGASAAGISAAETLRSLDEEAEIKIASEDTDVYSRCMLHYYLSDERDMDSLKFIEDDFFDKYNIQWDGGKIAVSLDSDNKTVHYQDGTNETYDKLLVATGSSAAVPPIKNIENTNNVFVLRDIDDANAIKDRLGSAKSAIVVGGGLIGIDVVTELMDLDMDLTVVEFADNILAMQLDEKASSVYHDKMVDAGVKIYTDCAANEAIIDENQDFKGLKLSNGEEIFADMVVIAAGVRANVSFLEDTDMEINRGIIVDEKCATNIEDVYAAGDVCAGKPGIWPLAAKQAIVAAHNMTGKEKVMESLFGFKNSMNFFGINTVSLGNPNIDKEGGYDVDVFEDDNIYKKITYKDGVIHSAIFQGHIDYVGMYEALIKDGIDISHIDKDVFELGYGDFFSIKDNAEFEYA